MTKIFQFHNDIFFSKCKSQKHFLVNMYMRTCSLTLCKTNTISNLNYLILTLCIDIIIFSHSQQKNRFCCSNS